VHQRVHQLHHQRVSAMGHRVRRGGARSAPPAAAAAAPRAGATCHPCAWHLLAARPAPARSQEHLWCTHSCSGPAPNARARSARPSTATTCSGRWRRCRCAGCCWHASWSGGHAASRRPVSHAPAEGGGTGAYDASSVLTRGRPRPPALVSPFAHCATSARCPPPPSLRTTSSRCVPTSANTGRRR
jgi:hypothetical protein